MQLANAPPLFKEVPRLFGMEFSTSLTYDDLNSFDTASGSVSGSASAGSQTVVEDYSGAVDNPAQSSLQGVSGLDSESASHLLKPLESGAVYVGLADIGHIVSQK
jgi:hypothetical protein